MMKKIFGIYRFASGDYADHSEQEARFEDERVCLTLHGHAVYDGRRIDPSALSELYLRNGRALTEKLGGLYILVIYDKREKKLLVFQDRATSPVTLYYLQDHDALLLATSLKTLLSHSSLTRKLNERAVETFFINGFVYGKETLIDGVYKLAPYCGLIAEKGEVGQFRASYRLSEYSKGQALDRFKPVLDQAIEKAADGEEIDLPLSSGYDSSYIAHVVSKGGDRKIRAFSVGGKHGKNELPLVEKNIAYFPNVELVSALTTRETYQCLPDIVERLEGATFESGIFLQYELMKLAEENGVRTLICGECADQVFNPYYYKTDRIFPDRENGDTYYEFSEYPYIFGTQLILKKSGILANSFGIETRYPYLDEELVLLSEPLGEINGKDKRCHVANCKECLPEEVLRNISKQGGATECRSLFENDGEIRRFFAETEQTDFYRKHAALINAHSYVEKEKQTGIALIKTKLRTFLLDLMHIGTESRRQQARFIEEIKLREYLCVAYLAEFEKKFVTGQVAE